MRIALLTLMLGAQVVAHAHAADHLAPTGKTQCPVCAVAQPNGAAAVDSDAATTDDSPQPPQFADGAPPSGPGHVRAVQARAPPISC